MISDPGSTNLALEPLESDQGSPEQIETKASQAVELIADALAKQRECVAGADWNRLEKVLPLLNEAVSAVEAFPGREDGLRAYIADLPGDRRSELEGRLLKAAEDRVVTSELIRLNLWRLNAIRTLQLQADVSDSYGNSHSRVTPGSRLSARA